MSEHFHLRLRSREVDRERVFDLAGEDQRCTSWGQSFLTARVIPAYRIFIVALHHNHCSEDVANPQQEVRASLHFSEGQWLWSFGRPSNV